MLESNPRFQMEIPNEQQSCYVGELICYASNEASLSVGVNPDRHNTFSCEWAVQALHPLHSHPEVLSVQKYHQRDRKKEKKKRGRSKMMSRTSGAFNFHRHAGFLISALRLKASCFVLPFCKAKPRDSVFHKKQIRDKRIYLRLNRSFNLHACFIGERRDRSVKWRNPRANPSAPEQP